MNDCQYNKNGVALAWEGGGAKGAFGVGVLKAIYDVFYPQDKWFVAASGTSVGGINSVMAVTKNINRLLSIWLNLKRSDILLFNGISPIKDGSLYSTDQLKKLFQREVNDEVFKTLQQINGQLFITAIRLENNETIIFDNFKNRDDLIECLLATSAIPGVFSLPETHLGKLGDGSLRYNLPLYPVMKNGYKKILVIVNEPLRLEGWVNRPEHENTRIIKSTDDLVNRVIELLNYNTTNKDLEKYFLIKKIEEQVNNLMPRHAELKKIWEQVYYPFKNTQILIIEPTRETNKVLDFSHQAIEDAINLGYQIANQNMEEIERFFET